MTDRIPLTERNIDVIVNLECYPDGTLIIDSLSLGESHSIESGKQLKQQILDDHEKAENYDQMIKDTAERLHDYPKLEQENKQRKDLMLKMSEKILQLKEELEDTYEKWGNTADERDNLQQKLEDIKNQVDFTSYSTNNIAVRNIKEILEDKE